jgi:hypothetical protein
LAEGFDRQETQKLKACTGRTAYFGHRLVLTVAPHTLNQWEALVRYLEDGRYDIDTNLVENAIRPTCIG